MSSSAAKTKGLLWIAATVALAGCLAYSLPWLARQVPWSAERWLGSVAGTVPPGALCRSAARAESAAALDTLLHRIYPLTLEEQRAPIQVEVIHGSSVNAFATLGGRIYVFEGLIGQARSPEELAGVLAHEIAHVRDRHVIEGFAVGLLTLGSLQAALPANGPFDARTTYLLLRLQFSRQQEYEADRDGLARLRDAQVDAGGFEEFFARAERMSSPPPFLSNHPSNESRRALAAGSRGYPTRPVLDPGAWQTLVAICR